MREWEEDIWREEFFLFRVLTVRNVREESNVVTQTHTHTHVHAHTHSQPDVLQPMRMEEFFILVFLGQPTCLCFAVFLSHTHTTTHKHTQHNTTHACNWTGASAVNERQTSGVRN